MFYYNEIDTFCCDGDNMTPEAKVKQSVKKLLTSYERLWYFMPVGGMLGRAGIPDFIVCCNGILIGIETKAGNGKPTALQKLTLQQIVDAGGLSIVVNEKNLHELEMMLDATSRKRPGCVSREERDSGAGQHASTER